MRYLLALLLVILFTANIAAQEDAADSNSNDSKMDRRTRIKFDIHLKKWRQLNTDMTDGEVRRLLGKPKLIIGGYPDIIWGLKIIR